MSKPIIAITVYHLISRILPALLILWPMISNAQDYQPMAVEGTHWIVGSDWLQTPWLDQKFSFTVRGDTSIQAIDYKKVYRETFEFNDATKLFSDKIIHSSLYALIRDDTLQRKVFAITEATLYDNCPKGEEYLLFDFSLEPGDTLNWCSLNGLSIPPNALAVADSIRFTNSSFSDMPRKTIFTVFAVTFYNDGLLTEQTVPIIEGLGYAHVGPFLEGSFLMDYCIGSSFACGLLSGSEEKTRSILSVYPNPSKDFLIVDAEREIYSSITFQILSPDGRLVRQQKLQELQNRINLIDLPAGIYTLRVLKKDRPIQHRRFIKQ